MSTLDLKVCVYLLTICYLKQIETLSGTNKGYKAEITVVTYDRDRKDNDDKAKLRILLVSILLFISIIFIPNVFYSLFLSVLWSKRKVPNPVRL